MAAMTRALNQPQWQNPGAAQRHSRSPALHGFERVQQADWDWPHCGDWMAQREEAWGAEAMRPSSQGHIQGNIDFGDWPEGFAWPQRPRAGVQ